MKEFPYEDLPIGVVAADSNNVILQSNAMFCEMTGYRKDELLDMKLSDLTHPQDWIIEQPFIDQMIKDGIQDYQIEKRFIRKDHSQIWVRYTVQKAIDTKNESPIFNGFAVDITDRKTLENRLHREERINSYILETTQDYFAYFSGSDNHMDWCNKVGESLEMEAPLTCHNVWTNAYEPCDDECPIFKTIQTGEILKRDMQFSDGKIWQFASYPIREDNRVHGVLVCAHNLVELSKKEKELEETNNLLNMTMEFASMGYWEMNIEDETIHFSEVLQRIYDFESNSIRFDKLTNMIYEDDRVLFQDVVKETLDNDGIYDRQFRIVNPVTSELKWFYIYGEVEYDESNTPAKMTGFAQDITAFKEIEYKYLEQNRMLSTLLDHLQVGVFMLDARTKKPILMNRYAELMLGKKIESDMNETNLNTMFGVYRVDEMTLYPNEEMPIFQALKGECISVNDMIIKKDDGTEIQLEVTACPVYDEQDRISVSIASFQDITSKILRNQQLVTMNRLNEIRAKIWSIASQTEDEKIMIKSLLDLVGPAVGLENTSYLLYNDQRSFLTVELQWRYDNADIGGDEIVPAWIFNRIAKKQYYVWPNEDIPKFIMPILELIINKYGNKSFIAIPYGDPDRPIGIITGTTYTYRKEFNQDEINLLIELSQLITLRSQQIKNRNALRESEERYRLISEKTSDGIMVIEKDKIVYASPSYLRILGYPEEEVVGKSVYDIYGLIHPDDRQYISDISSKAILSQVNNRQYYYRVKNVRGKYIWREDSVAYEYGENGEVLRIYIVARDITERKKNQERMNELIMDLNEAQAIAKIGSWKIDLSTDQIEWSDEFYGILELDPEKVKPKISIIDQIIHPDDRILVDSTFKQSVKTGIPFDITHRFLMKDGRIKYVRAMNQMEYNETGKIVRVRGVTQDITEQKIVELELKSTAEKLEMSNRDLERFAYSASHDLKEPLRMIASYVNLIKRRIDKHYGEDPDLDDFVYFAKDGADRMRKLIDSLLAFSRIKNNEELFKKSDLNEIIHNVEIDLKEMIAETGTLLKISDLPVVYVNPHQIQTVFQNLVTNAIKYQKKGSKPKVTIGFNDRKDYYEFYVKDNGIGIAPDNFGRLFQLFSRLHGISEYPGTGIGLASIRRIVEFHKGNIWIDSKPGKGSVFYFTLPK